MNDSRLRKNDKPESFYAIALWRFAGDDFEFYGDNGRIVIFDTFNHAYSFIAQLGGGNVTQWSSSGEMAYWPTQTDPTQPNKAQIIKHDVYNVPPGYPVKSEARGLDWKYHVHFNQYFNTGGREKLSSSRKFVNVGASA